MAAKNARETLFYHRIGIVFVSYEDNFTLSLERSLIVSGTFYHRTTIQQAICDEWNTSWTCDTQCNHLERLKAYITWIGYKTSSVQDEANILATEKTKDPQYIIHVGHF